MAKKNWVKAQVWGERVKSTLDGPLMPVIKQMFVSVPVDNQEYLLRELQKIHEEMKQE